MKTSFLPEKLLVGFSGGADSTALLLRCHELSGKTIIALHFNHAFDDENGDESEAYCRALCERYAIPLIVGRCTLPWDRQTTKEVFARNQRFAFFQEAIRSTGISTLLLAHHAGDRAENTILRLARGSGLEGLTSFRDATPFPGHSTATILRPLLDETHATQVAWLQKRNITWIEDSSNIDTSIPRNAIRHTLGTILPHFVAGANLATDLLTEENDYLNQAVENHLLEATPSTLTLAPNTPLVLLRRALRHWIPLPLSYTQLQTLAKLPQTSITTLSKHLRVQRTAPMTWTLLHAQPNVQLPPLLIQHPGTYTFGPWTITIGQPPPPTTSHHLTTSTSTRLPLPLLVRTRQPGDKLTPSGFKGSKKVQDILTDLHIPPTQRATYPLFIDPATQRLLYLPGHRPASLPTTTLYTVTLTANYES